MRATHLQTEGFPDTQYAVQLVGPDDLRLNTAKPVLKPVGYQILGKVEATGLCFSDLKLLKQFDQHVRKGEVASGIEREVLDSIPSYVPGPIPAVPGHETVLRIVSIGEKVKNHKVGERCLVQTDYRTLITNGGSNAAFGYNFEGGLQEYVIIDERISKDVETGERFLIPVGEERSAAAICLVEPWACVEDSYLNADRGTIAGDGNLLIVADPGRAILGVAESFAPGAPPARIALRCSNSAQVEAVYSLGISVERVKHIVDLPEHSFDDVVYFGSDRTVIETLNGKLANRGIINIVKGGKRIGSTVAIGVGRIHYGMTRWIGTTGDCASDSYRMIPETGEIRAGENCLVIGAAGPMGQMHVIRNACLGVPGVKITAADIDDSRLASLGRKAGAIARENGIELRVVNSITTPLSEKFTYTAIMVPSPQLVAQAIAESGPDSVINVFAGIPATTIQKIDLDALIEKRVFMFGTSGSVLRDMRVVLERVEKGRLDTNVSVDAISGMAGAADGIRAVENRTLAGKIVVFPELHEVGLVPLDRLGERFPTVAARLSGGRWTKEAEEELLRSAR